MSSAARKSVRGVSPEFVERQMLPSALPMGWRNAVLFSFLCGLALGGIPWLILTAITLHRGWWKWDLIFVLLFVMGQSITLLIEFEERDRIKKGTARDIRAVYDADA